MDEFQSMSHMLNKIEEIRDITDEILRVHTVYDLTHYDNEIDYGNEPNLYKKCPHCDSEKWNWIKEVLEDVVLKVRCRNCHNNYYRNFGK